MELQLPYHIGLTARTLNSLPLGYSRLLVPFAIQKHMEFHGGIVLSQECKANGSRFKYQDLFLERSIKMQLISLKGFASLLFVLKGGSAILSNFKSRLVLEPGMFYCLNNLSQKRYSLSFSKGKHSLFQIELTPEPTTYISRLASEIPYFPIGQNSIKGISSLGQIQMNMFSIINEIRTGMPMIAIERDFFLQAQKQLMVSLIIRQLNVASNRLDHDGKNKIMFNLYHYIENNLKEKLTIPDLGLQFNMSESSLRKNFKKCFHI